MGERNLTLETIKTQGEEKGPLRNQKRENNGWKPRTLFPVPCCESIRGKRKEGRQARRNERVSTLRRNAESKMTLVGGDLHDNVKAEY
jgi:hypothetical protein